MMRAPARCCGSSIAAPASTPLRRFSRSTGSNSSQSRRGGNFQSGYPPGAASNSDTTVIRTMVDSLYRAGALQFPFGHMVYANQLDEFYWWDNHVPIPLYLALSSINQRLRQQQHDR